MFYDVVLPSATQQHGSATCCCSVVKSCLTLYDSMDRHARLFCSPLSLEFAQIMSIESVMLSNHLIFCCPLLLLPSIFPSIRVFPNESVLYIKWPKYSSFSFSIRPSSEYSGLIFSKINLFDLFAV